jgi:hypothetical protein
VHEALTLTRHLIGRFGPRPSASAASRAVAEELAQEAAGFADKGWTESFTARPSAFLGWIRILVFLYAVAVILIWFNGFLPAALLTSLGLALMIGEFFLYREWLDPLFPRREGRNALAALEPTGPARGQLIVSGHHDSAQIFNFLAHQPQLYPVRVLGGIGALFLLFLTSWILVIWQAAAGSPAWSVTAATLFSFLFLLVGQLWWFAARQATPGAGDNLASTAAAWQTLRLAAGEKAAGNGLQCLRLVAASWDAEEAGLRGARAWATRHLDDDLALPTWNLNLECLYDPADFFFLTSDVNGSVRLSTELAGRCQRLLADLGHEAPCKPITFLAGGTDAAELARAGAAATTLMGMPWGNTNRSAVYHTPADLPETVSPSAVEAAIQLALALAGELDRELAERSSV